VLLVQTTNVDLGEILQNFELRRCPGASVRSASEYLEVTREVCFGKMRLSSAIRRRHRL
jgi:hypothetical protein